MNQLRVVLGLGVTVLALAVACGGGDKGGNPADSGTGNPTDNSPMCDKVSGSEVSTALGISGFQDGEVQDPMGCDCTTCDYDRPGSYYLSIIYDPTTSRSSFDVARESYNTAYPKYGTQDAPGVGDAAFTLSIPSEDGSSFTNTLVFLKGTTQVTITTTSTATLDQVTQLAVLVAGRL